MWNSFSVMKKHDLLIWVSEQLLRGFSSRWKRTLVHLWEKSRGNQNWESPLTRVCCVYFTAHSIAAAVNMRPNACSQLNMTLQFTSCDSLAPSEPLDWRCAYLFHRLLGYGVPFKRCEYTVQHLVGPLTTTPTDMDTCSLVPHETPQVKHVHTPTFQKPPQMCVCVCVCVCVWMCVINLKKAVSIPHKW